MEETDSNATVHAEFKNYYEATEHILPSMDKEVLLIGTVKHSSYSA